MRPSTPTKIVGTHLLFADNFLYPEGECEISLFTKIERFTLSLTKSLYLTQVFTDGESARVRGKLNAKQENVNEKKRRTSYRKLRVRVLWLTATVFGLIIIGSTILIASADEVDWLFR